MIDRRLIRACNPAVADRGPIATDVR